MMGIPIRDIGVDICWCVATSVHMCDIVCTQCRSTADKLWFKLIPKCLSPGRPDNHSLSIFLILSVMTSHISDSEVDGTTYYLLINMNIICTVVS